jgi:hypothetical protein
MTSSCSQLRNAGGAISSLVINSNVLILSQPRYVLTEAGATRSCITLDGGDSLN